MSFPQNRMRRLRSSPSMRRFVRETSISVDDLVYPLFVREGEGIKETGHDEIMVLNCDNGLCLNDMNQHIHDLVRLAEACDAGAIKDALKKIVPEYQPWTSQGEIVQSVSTECPASPRLFKADAISETGET